MSKFGYRISYFAISLTVVTILAVISFPTTSGKRSCLTCKHKDTCKRSMKIGLQDCSSPDLGCVQILNEKKEWLYLGCDQPDIPSNARARNHDPSLPKECTRRTLSSESQNNNTEGFNTILVCYCKEDKCNGKNMLTGEQIGIK